MRNWRGVLIVFAFIIFLVALPTEKRGERMAAKAASLTAYPTYCLGGWENPGNAAGEPNVAEGDDSFSPSNSAFLNQKAAQIFCGYFQSNDKSYPPKTVTLKFSWKMVFENQPVQPTTSDTNTTDEHMWASVISGTSTATSTPATPTSSTPIPISTSTEPENNEISSPSSTVSSSTDTSSTDTIFVSSTAATSSVDTLSTGTTATTPLVSSSTDQQPPTTPDTPSSTATSSSMSFLFSNSPNPSFWNFLAQKVFAQSDPSSQAFLDVSYNLEDGKNWQSAGQVTEINWRGLSVEIPITSWDDIEKLQVQLTPSLSVDMPEIYLDGMWLEVNYGHSILDTVKEGANAILDAATSVSDTVNNALDAVANAVDSVLKPDMVALLPEASQKETPPPPKLAFSIKGTLRAQTNDIPWMPENTKENPAAIQSNNSPTITALGDNSFKIEGACSKEYYTVMLFKNSTDYLTDPSLAIFNQAYQCVNNSFSQTLTDKDFPSNLADGDYYLLTADQGARGPWQPHGTIQIITIGHSDQSTTTTVQ